MKVICSGIWKNTYKNKEGVEVTVNVVKFSLLTDNGIYEYPYSFQMKTDLIKPEIMKEYDVDFAFGYFIKNIVDKGTGEIIGREPVPIWKVENIKLAGR